MLILAYLRQQIMRLSSNLSLFFLLPLLSGILLWLSWPPFPSAFLIFIAFLPLLIAEKLVSEKFKKYTALKAWLSIYIGLLIWNIATTWWVGKASLIGGFFANFFNPLLMTVPFMFSRYVRNQLGNRVGYTSLIFFWMSFEYIHLRWDLTWPWLTIGNVFAVQHTWIQWYEYTGVFGGALWIWIVNLLFFHLIYFKVFPTEKKEKAASAFSNYLPMLITLIIIGLPILISQKMYRSANDKGVPVNVTVLQPNFDPYVEKFTVPYRIQMEKMLSLSEQKLSDTTDYLVWPETSIQDDIWINSIAYQKPVRDLKAEVQKYPSLTIIAGINGFQRYNSADEGSVTTRELVNRFGDTIYFDIYNTSIQVDSSNRVPYYHKSKLVPGVERMPYPGVFGFLEKKAIDLGGISGSLGIQKERSIFYNHDSIGVGTAICYESVFGEYVTRYINKGADLMFIITNDGWWGNTAGYKQHCAYAKLRAIETRRSIARSANTGISCFVNQRGDISQATKWREDAVINETIFANHEKTFYVIHGDFIARAALYISGLLIVLAFIRSRIKNK